MSNYRRVGLESHVYKAEIESGKVTLYSFLCAPDFMDLFVYEIPVDGDEREVALLYTPNIVTKCLDLIAGESYNE